MVNPITESIKRMGLWIKIYRNLCRSCQNKLKSGIDKSQSQDKNIEQSKSNMDRLCSSCKERIKKIMESAK